MTKATTIYSYTLTYSWKFKATYPGLESDADAVNDVVQGMNNEAAQQFSAQMVKAGHWYKIDSTTSNAVVGNKTGNPYGQPIWAADFAGSTTINYESDLNEPSTSGNGLGSSGAAEHEQPSKFELLINVQTVQGWELAVIAILTAIVEAMAAYPLIFAIIVLVGVLVIAYWIVSNMGGLGTFFAPGLAGQIIEVIAIIGVIIALIFLLPGVADHYLPKLKKGKKK